MSGKGFIEPHHSHLPRRSKKPEVKPPVSNNSFDSNKSEGGFDSKDGSRDLSKDPERRRPVAAAPEVDEAAAPTAANQPRKVSSASGPLQPHVNNLPRRHRRRPQSLTRQREQQLCLQEIGQNSRVFIGKSGRIWKGESTLGDGNRSNSSDDEDEDGPDEEEEARLQQRYSAIVRLVPGDFTADDRQHKGLLCLSLPKGEPAEAGCTQLTTRQIRSACNFLHRALYSSNAGEGEKRPVLILAPQDYAADAFALAICFHAATVPPPTGRRPTSTGVPPLTPRSGESDSEAALQFHLPLAEASDIYSNIHQLITKLHDDDLMVIDDDDGHGSRAGRGDLKAGPAGLREEWRGLLRYEGIVNLDGVWTPASVQP